MPWKPARLKPFMRSIRPSLKRKFGADRSTGVTRAISICGKVVVVGPGARIDDNSCCAGPDSPVASFDECSGQMNSDFGGAAPTFLYQHLRPSISRQDHRPDSD